MDGPIAEIIDEFFGYDKKLPLEQIEKRVESDLPESDCLHVTFTSVHDRRVPALLTLPAAGVPPYPVVVLLHGVFGHKTSPNQIKRSDALVAAGFATLRVDGEYCGERKATARGEAGLQSEFYYRNRDAMIQTAIDLMRAVDYLTARDSIDAARVGFVGFSMGGIIGTTFCALDARVKAVMLGVAGGDFDKLNMRLSDGSTKERIRRAYRIVDPCNYVSRISPRPLLMINALNDEAIPRVATEALYDAARDPKQIIWYDCGHATLPDEYLEEMTRFFDSELG